MSHRSQLVVIGLLAAFVALPTAASAEVKVVATTSTYASLARTIGGDKVSVLTIASPDQHVHFV